MGSTPEVFASFRQIVADGILLGLGMPKFGDQLAADQIESIKSYILSEAKWKLEIAGD